jgi:fatty-acyl-CoA synthase
MKSNPYQLGLDKNPANFAALTPLNFLERAAAVFPDYPALVHGEQRATWRETYQRCCRLASALSRRGIGPGDTASIVAPNTPAMYEAHFGVPMTGAVLHAINTRLDADAIAFQLRHGESKLVLVDREFGEVVAAAVGMLSTPPLVVDINDPLAPPGRRVGAIDYEALLAEGDTAYPMTAPSDEWDALALSYTSGTTGNPKGVVTHHRGAYLNALSNILIWGVPQHPVYLWTLPMFHCNGWCFPWSIAALAGVNVCLRRVEAAAIFDAIRTHGVTHYCGAPIVHNLMINAPAEMRAGIQHKVFGLVAGAAPPAAVIEGIERIGFDITHVYGLTEVYGPASVCAKKRDWDGLPLNKRADKNARQGVRYLLQEGLMVAHPETLEPVPWDGETMGEVFFRGNITMKGYLKNPQATEEAFRGGWFHTGDLAVQDPDGYIKIRDRSKDIIISGGENISSIEVEDCLFRHPKVLFAAVVAKHDEKWGETPCAFVELKEGASADAAEIITYCRDNLAHYKAPKTVVFGPIPKTSTGKIQKFLLRERAKNL